MPRFVRIQNRRMATPIDLDDGIRSVRCTREIMRRSIADKEIMHGPSIRAQKPERTQWPSASIQKSSSV
jgi:hypothetical protein